MIDFILFHALPSRSSLLVRNAVSNWVKKKGGKEKINTRQEKKRKKKRKEKNEIIL